TGYLALGWFPLLVCPGRTKQNMLLPLRHWPRGLLHLWRDADRRIPEEDKTQPDAPAATPLTPRQYAVDPVRLSPAAAAEVRKIMTRERIDPRSHLRVGIEPQGSGFAYDLDITENADDP